jgi:hypothetical protein
VDVYYFCNDLRPTKLSKVGWGVEREREKKVKLGGVYQN